MGTLGRKKAESLKIVLDMRCEFSKSRAHGYNAGESRRIRDGRY